MSMGETGREWNNYVEFAVETDIGMRRSNNQDSYATVLATSEDLWNRRGHLFIVADGMGAHAAGELASKMAVDCVAHLYHKSPESSPPEALLQAVRETNAEIFRRGHENSEFLHMGTTASMLSLLPQGALIAHVGDSRVYRLRSGLLEQLTFDHSLVWELKAAGQLGDNSDLAGVVPKNVITRSLGPNPSVQVDLEGPLAVEAGDVFLLCSDGLTGRLEDELLAAVLANYSPKDAARTLLNIANLRGGHDNITLIVARIGGEVGGDQAKEVEPIKIGRKQAGSSVVNSAAIGIVVAWLMAVVFVVTGNFATSAVSFAAGFAGILGLRWYQSRLRAGGVLLSDERRLGRGPYTRTPCPAPDKFAASLPVLVQELREFAEEANWVSHWPNLGGAIEQVQELVRQHQFESAFEAFARAVEGLMGEVRKHQRKRSSDSSISL